jgi:hypothetical protein
MLELKTISVPSTKDISHESPSLLQEANYDIYALTNSE